jgi:protease-4
MKPLIAGMVFLLAGICLAEPTTQPTDADGSSIKSLPKPGDLIRQIKAAEAKQAAMTKVAFFDLSQPVTEKPADFSLFGDSGATTLRDLIDRLHQARDDKEVRAVLITLGDPGLNLSQAQEVRDALSEIRQAGKRTFVYADSYDTVDYMLASTATDICLLQGGDIMIPGVGLEATFYKGLFDKVGVKADYVQIGEYKGADEEYTRTGASDELKGEFNKLTSSLYDQIIDGISFERHLPRTEVAKMVDDSIIPAAEAENRGWVDHLIDQDGLRDLLSQELGNQVNLLRDYGTAPRQAIDLSSPLAIFQLFKPQVAEADKPEIALIYADGVITDGEGDGGLFSEAGIAAEPMRRAFRAAARDDNVKAVVLRINSPGGSALASEVMWQAARHLAAKKPLIISVGDMAASGGYYLASSGSYIIADPAAIVGSIGVVGGKFVTHDLYDKLGITTEAFSRGANAGLFSSDEPFTDRQRKMVTNWMRGTYDQFTQRVMTTRADKIRDIDQVARGRIFTAKQALDLGMVDQIGGLDAAITHAAKQVGMGTGEYDVRVLPAPRTLADLIGMGQNPDAAFAFKPKIEISPDSILRVLPDSTRAAMMRQLQTIRLLQAYPVVLISPYVVTTN